MNFLNQQKGFSLYLAIVIMGALLALALGINTILLGQLKTTRELGDSVIAFYAADSGIERELYEENYLTQGVGFNYVGLLDLDGDGGSIIGGNCPAGLTDFNDACYTVTIKSLSPTVVQSIGVFKKSRRAIEITFD